MPKAREDIIQDISYWKMAISRVENIPLNPNHTYKNENNIYERLTECVKDWTESVFGVYTNKNGELVNLPEDEESTEYKDWMEAVAGKMTPLTRDWYQAALKGDKEGKWLFLPQMKQSGLEGVQETALVREEINNAVHSTFFPAYRALRDSFSKRWWFEWIFNHRQYVAERDSLKVMTSLITHLTDYTQEKLDAEYIQYRSDIKDEEIANATVEFSNREVHMNEPEDSKELFKDEKTQSLEVKVKNRSGEIKVERGTRDELLAHGDYDGYFEDVMPMDEVLNIDYDEAIEDNMTAEEKLAKFDKEEYIDELCRKFMKELKTTLDNEDSIWRAMHIHLYPELHKAAAFFAMMYDAVAGGNTGEALKREFDKVAKKSAKNLFETAFKALGEEDSREIVTTVNGKEVREKVGGSLFGIKTLKDRIVAAQKIANVMLANRTPVGFYAEWASSEFAKSFHILENTDALSDYIKANYGKKYGESEINAAVKSAKNVFGVMHRGEQAITSYVFEIGYRPDPAKINSEKVVLGNAQKMIIKNLITDEAIKNIVTENINKWKQMRDMQKPGTTVKMSAIEKKWIEADKKLSEKYKDYDATAAESVVESALDQYNQQKKEKTEPMKVHLDEPKTEIVPPVASKVAQINALDIEK